MQLEKLTNEQRIKHVWNSSPKRDVLLLIVADLEKRLAALEKPAPAVTASFAPRKKHEGDK